MPKLLRYCIACLLCLCPFASGYGQVQAVPVKQHNVLDLSQGKSIGLEQHHVEYLAEENGLNRAHILKHSERLTWKPVEKKAINLGKNTHPMWIRFQVSNPTQSPVERLLEIDWIHLSEVDFYQQKADGNWLHHQAGLTRDKSVYYRDNPSYLFPIRLQPGESRQILIRVYSTFICFVPMTIWEEQAFTDFQKQHFIFYALAFGVLMAMMLYNASLYVFTRDRLFLFYSYYVLAVILYEISNTGIANYMIWGDSQWWRLNGYALSVYLCFLGVALFVRDFFSLDQKGGLERGNNTFFIVFCCLGILDQLLGTFLMRGFAGALIMLMCITLMISAIKNAINGDINARYFVVAWSALVGFTFLNIATIEGYFAKLELANYGQLLGFVVEMLLLSFALADRINRERIQREQAQAKAIDLQKNMVHEREEKIAAQEEVLKLQQQSNEQLEEQVKERTQVLELTMANLKNVNSELSKLSVTDPLTQVNNRRYFDEVFDAELKRSERTQRPVTLILVDVDHFKQFNDSYGHLAGDDCLKMVAKALQRAVTRENDLVARFGGEEFAIVLPEVDESQAYTVAENIRRAIESIAFVCKGEKVPISASLGVVSVGGAKQSEPRQTVSSIISAADEALYEAKNRGRNCSVLAQLAAS